MVFSDLVRLGLVRLGSVKFWADSRLRTSISRRGPKHALGMCRVPPVRNKVGEKRCVCIRTYALYIGRNCSVSDDCSTRRCDMIKMGKYNKKT